MKGYKVLTNLSEKTVKMAFQGALCHEDAFPKLDLKNIEVIEINLEEVASINSSGIRNWLKWVGDLCNEVELNFFNVPKSMMDQVNMIPNFLPKNAKIKSFVMNYNCDNCDSHERKIYTQEQHVCKNEKTGQIEVRIPEVYPCKFCGGQLQLEMFKAKFFRFLKSNMVLFGVVNPEELICSY
jgi:hypothetical protein